MGQAKQRGTYEQRQAQGIQRKAEAQRRWLEQRERENIEHAKRRAEREAQMTPEQRQRRKTHRRRQTASGVIALAASLSHSGTDIGRVWGTNGSSKRREPSCAQYGAGTNKTYGQVVPH
jgi:beta-phosphoglucomutase-like phosphatase (HAD superfamily)